MKPIRNSAKAMIVEGDRILCIKMKDDEGFYYILPGGGQEAGEPLLDALKRECGEELSIDVTVHDLRFVREYIGKNHEFAEFDADVHQVEFMFSCTLKQDSEIKNGTNPDKGQVGFEWLSLDRLEDYRLYPKVLRPLIRGSRQDSPPVYLGNVN